MRQEPRAIRNRQRGMTITDPVVGGDEASLSRPDRTQLTHPTADRTGGDGSVAVRSVSVPV